MGQGPFHHVAMAGSSRRDHSLPRPGTLLIFTAAQILEDVQVAFSGCGSADLAAPGAPLLMHHTNASSFLINDAVMAPEIVMILEK